MTTLEASYQPPALHSQFVPAELAVRRLERTLDGEGHAVLIALVRPDGTCFREQLSLRAPEQASFQDWQLLERTVKRLLWQKGGSRLYLSGAKKWADRLAGTYSSQPAGERAFDADFMGDRLFNESFQVSLCDESELPPAREPSLMLGGNLSGCRIGFDLGGSDRKCAALIDGKVVFSEEIAWDPYFQKDPVYHRSGIEESLQRAAAHLPRVDAIGGSAAGVYINNEALAGSLYRGLSQEDFNRSIRWMFRDIGRDWGVPLAVANDGEVTALAAALSCGEGGILGISMGTSTAAGYVRPDKKLTCWLNELAFVPVDLHEFEAPVDEWSGDRGCGAQYFSQQAVARLGPLAGITRPSSEPFAEYLSRVQSLAAANDPHALGVFETIGCYLGHTLTYWQRHYEFDKVLLLGRVLSGVGGKCIVDQAKQVLREYYPATEQILRFIEVSERDKRHGQAIAAASLPII